MNTGQPIGDVLVSMVRTTVAIVVGAFVSWAVRHGASIDAASATAYVTPIAIATYYGIVRVLEARFPVLGWLLGIAKAPTYNPTPLVAVPAPTPDAAPVAPPATINNVILAPPVAADPVAELVVKPVPVTAAKKGPATVPVKKVSKKG